MVDGARMKNGDILKSCDIRSELIRYWMTLGHEHLRMYRMGNLYDKDGIYIDEAILSADEVLYKNTGVRIDREYHIEGIPRMDNCYSDVLVTMIVEDVDKLMLWRMAR